MTCKTSHNISCLSLLHILLLLLALPAAVASLPEVPVSEESVLPRDWPIIPIAAGFMALFWLMIRCGLPEANVSGFMMMIFSFLWWNLRVDPRTTPTVLWTVFAMGLVFTLWYGYSKFAENRMNGSHVPFIVFVALLFDLSAFPVVPSSAGSDSQGGLIGFFLPSLSCTLWIWVYLVPLARKSLPYIRSRRPQEDVEIGLNEHPDEAHHNNSR